MIAGSQACDPIGKKSAIESMAGGLGFEPRLTESESAVLPLNYPPPSRAIADKPFSIRFQADRRGQSGLWAKAPARHGSWCGREGSGARIAAAGIPSSMQFCDGNLHSTRWSRKASFAGLFQIFVRRNNFRAACLFRAQAESRRR